MDVLLADDAALEAATLAAAAKGRPAAGFVIGHRRGPRYVAERLVAAGCAGVPTEADAREADRIWDGRLIGFFATGPLRGARRSGLLRPAFCGKCVLVVGAARRDAPPVRGFVVDFDGRFTLAPLPVAAAG